MTRASFGDNIRIKDTRLTRKRGIANKQGVVYGETIPSVTGIEAIGEASGGLALNVHLADGDESLWLAPELIEIIDHAIGTEITLDGVNKRWVRRSDGGWDEFASVPAKRVWWKFWA
jgi:hypothetical protein